jgi:membrane protein
VWREIWDDNCVDLAAQTSFYFILALFPFFIILAVLVSYLPFSGIWHGVVVWIIHYFPLRSQNLMIQTIFGLTQERASFLSFGVLASAWAASTGIMSLMTALNIAYDVPESRGYWRRRIVSLGMLVVLCLFFMVGFGLVTAGGGVGRAIEAHFQTGPGFKLVWRLVRWTLTVVLLVVGMALLERVLPDTERPWRWVTAGALFVVGASTPTSLGLRFYVTHFTLYPTAYGTLGAFFVLMLWVYTESLILLVGAEVNSEMEKLRRRRATAFQRRDA